MSNPSNARRFLTAGLGALTITVMCLAVTPTVTGATAPTQPAAHVDPLIGTALADDDFPGADTPFGMVQWSPDTTPSRPDGGGYAYGDPLISGFSLTHLSGLRIGRRYPDSAHHRCSISSPTDISHAVGALQPHR